MKKVLKVTIKIILELIIVCILTVVAMFLMKNTKNGLRIIANMILTMQTTVETEVTQAAEIETEKDKIVKEEPIVILDSPNEETSTEETEATRMEEQDIIIINDGSSEYEENEIIEFFTEKGTYFFE